MKTRYTILQRALEVIGAVLFIAYIIYLFRVWAVVPDKIPAHFNGAGLVDRWGKKNELLMLPIMGVVLYLGLTLISFFPGVWNVPKIRNPQNLPFVYSMMKTMLIGLKVEILALFFCITYFQAGAQNLPWMVLPIYLTVLFGTIISCLVRCYRA